MTITPIRTSRTVEELEHLTAAIEHLHAAGFDLEARHIQASAEEIRNRFLAQKIDEVRQLKAQLAALHRAHQQVARQVELDVKVVEFSDTALERIGFDLDRGVDFVDTKRLAEAIKHFEQKGLVKVLVAPKMIVPEGRVASIATGGKSVGGVQIAASVHVIDDEHVRLEIRPRFTTMVPNLGLRTAGVPVGLRVEEFETNVKMELGKTVVVAGEVQQRVQLRKVSQTLAKAVRTDVATLILVTPRLVEGKCHAGPCDKTASRPEHETEQQ